jgi:peptide/nickel transport system substrate-binding protein
MRPLILLAAAAILAVVPYGAQAQKAEDTIRIAVNDSFPILDTYHYSLDEAAAFDRGVYLPLISYDQAKKQWVNLLTRSFRRIDPLTIEFDLREDITFHNGNKFDAADVKGTFEYLADPNVKIQFKSRYDWVKEVEILGPYKVRIHAKKAFSTDLGMLAYRMRVRDIETMNALADKAEYGKNPNGVGPYRVTSIDRNAGLTLEAVPNHWEGGKYFPQPVKRVKALFMPDRQTQVAQLMTGNIDLMRNITSDDAKNLGANPNLGVTPTGSEILLYVTLDAAGRSKNKIMTDARVRKAFVMAIDRKSLATHILPGGDIAVMNKAICFPTTIACAPTTDVYAYNPAEAKKLLAEAGFPNGVDLILHAHEPVKYVAEAIAGEVRKVGFRASVDSMPSAAYVRMRGNGEFTAFTGFFPAGTHPDTAVLNDFFFNDNRDYWQDAMIRKAMDDGDDELDEAKRTALYTPILDKVNREAYILPISELPIVWAHNKDVVVKPNPLTSSLPNLGDYGWKK